MSPIATPDYVLLQIRSLEEQLRGIRSLLNGLPDKSKETKGLGDLYGIWKGQVHFSDEQIENAKTAWIKPLPS